jgi:NADH:ubiquinone oxidoreductase subunit E
VASGQRLRSADVRSRIDAVATSRSVSATDRIVPAGAEGNRAPPGPQKQEGEVTTKDAALDTVLADLVARHGRDPGRLLQILLDVQARFACVPAEAVPLLAEALALPIGEVESTVEFYSFLSRTPVGTYRVLFSDNITDRMLGNQTIFDHMAKRLGVRAGEVSEDGLVSIDTTSCTGMCDQGPAILVNGIAITRMTMRRADQICELRSEERRVGKECRRLCRSRWSPYH